NATTYTSRCSWMRRSRDPNKITSIDWVYLLIGFFLITAYNVQYLNDTGSCSSGIPTLMS
ncbi:MAG: hypothetical protein QF535_02585, partial [Anaerolineales bacterium]|nr:hypothetical protein [Anaerolineales bacterium]